MPGKIKVKILAGRNLPVMDRSGDTTDAYVELKFGNITYKTDVCRKSLNPQWNSEWYRFEVDDAELQDEPLQIRLMDYDTYSANDAIGKVYVNLNPLLLPGMLPPVKNIWTMEASMSTSVGSQGSVMTGWIPVYDTMHGIRGEVNIIIKVELFSDFNKFRQSSCGVQFFYSPNIPYGYHAQMIHGFVEELVVSDDPEYKWIDKIRTPRASNEARQTLFFKLSGEVQRKIGLKALDLGGNAVIGYLQNFDLEGESGIVARGIGTAVTLVKLHDVLGFPCDNANIEEIAFALSSRGKTQTERLEADDRAPLVPAPVRFPASCPTPIGPTDRTNPPPHHAWSLSSLTRSERVAESSWIRRGCARTRGKRRAKRIPFFRSDASRARWTSGDTDLALPPEYLIDETMRSLRAMLTPRMNVANRESLKPRLSKQIKDLRAKFDTIAVVADRRYDAGSSVGSSIANDPKGESRSLGRAKTTGEVMTALLIGSIRDMPLGNIGDADSASSVSSGNERPDDEARKTRGEEEDPRDSKVNANTDGTDVEGRHRRDALSSVDETEVGSSLDDDDDGGGDGGDDGGGSGSSEDASDDSTSYNILDDSRYSLDGNLDMADDSSGLRANTPVDRKSGAESRTDSTLQLDSDATDRSSSNPSLAAMEKVAPRNDEIPIITVEVHGSTDSDVSASSVSLSIRPSDNPSREVDVEARRRTFDGASWRRRGSGPGTEEDKRSRDSIAVPGGGSSPHAAHRVHLTWHERDLRRARGLLFARANGRPRTGLTPPSPGETEARASASDKTGEDPTAAAGSSRDTSIDTNASYEEADARTTVERRTCIRDLIKLIDTEMMVVAARTTTARDRRTASLRSGRRKREVTRKTPTSAPNSLESFPFHGTSTRLRRDDHGRNAPPRVPRDVRSTADRHHRRHHHHHHYPPSDQRVPIVPSRDVSRSRDSSLTGLTNDHRTRVSPGSNRAIVPVAGIDRRSDLPGVSGEPSEVRDNERDSVIRNLDETCSHIDRTEPTNTANMTYNLCVSRPSPDLRQQDEAASSVSPSHPLPVVPSVAARVSQSPATRALTNTPLHRRSSDSDLSVTPKGNSLGSSDRSMAGPLRAPAAVVRPMNQDTLEMLEYPFITMQRYPPGFILHIGGLVSSRSVKLLERISNPEEPEGRDAWWTEIRMEVRSHARALACNVVIGYKEETSICDDVCVLSASGTAAVINFHNSAQEPDGVVLNKLQQSVTAVAVDVDREKSQQKPTAAKIEKTDVDASVATHSERQSGGRACRHLSESNDHEASCGQSQLRCNLCHLPYSESSVPFRVNVSKCAICKRARVPDVMFTTIEVPANIPTTGRGCFIQATVCKSKRDLRGELNAKEISDGLPFLEYELHSLLLNKLKVKGMNAIFGLRLQVSVGERFIIGMAVGTAVYLTALPPPSIPQIASGNSWHNDEQLAEIQRSIVETVKKNREFYHLKPIGVNDAENGRVATSDTDESDEDLPELDLGLGTRDACVLEVDDIEDMDRISSLMDDRPPDDFHVVNTQTIPGLEDLEIVRNLQMFTQVSRAKIPTGQSASMPSKYFARLLQSLYFKLRRMVPCALCDMQFKVALPEQDEIQLTVIGMALGLGEPLKTNRFRRKVVCRSLSKDQVRKSDDSDMIFSLDEDHLENNVTTDSAIRAFVGNPIALSGAPVQKSRQRSPLRSKTFSTHRRKYVPLKGRYGVDITPLSYLPGGRIERYQGNLNFFFIRESTSIRENGGLSGFTHSFVMEVLAIVRAHITALGGNAMVAFFMTQCVLLHSPHKNQGQCLINVGGDVVTVSYYADEKHNTVSNC